MSSAIGAEAQEVVDLLESFAVPATADPGVFVPLVTEHGSAALVGPPAVTVARLDGGLALEFPVHLACTAPGGLADFEALWSALELAMPALRHRGEVLPGSLTVGDLVLPTYELTAHRRI